jgi:hypothetical protein
MAAIEGGWRSPSARKRRSMNDLVSSALTVRVARDGIDALRCQNDSATNFFLCSGEKDGKREAYCLTRENLAVPMSWLT